jgi:hypothetical protein
MFKLLHRPLRGMTGPSSSQKNLLAASRASTAAPPPLPIVPERRASGCDFFTLLYLLTAFSEGYVVRRDMLSYSLPYMGFGHNRRLQDGTTGIQTNHETL